MGHVIGPWQGRGRDSLGQLTLALVVVDSVAGHRRELPAAVVLVVEVVGHVLQILHVGPAERVRERERERVSEREGKRE